MMGVFFLSNWLGNLLAGWTAGFFSSMPLSRLFAAVAAVCLVAAAVMAPLIKPVRNLMGDVHWRQGRGERKRGPPGPPAAQRPHRRTGARAGATALSGPPR